MLIKDGPPGEKPVIINGDPINIPVKIGGNPEEKKKKKEEYMKLCNILIKFEKNPPMNESQRTAEKEAFDGIIQVLKDILEIAIQVHEYENQRIMLKICLEEILKPENYAVEDTYINKINIISFQCIILFNKLLMDTDFKKEETVELFNISQFERFLRFKFNENKIKKFTDSEKRKYFSEYFDDPHPYDPAYEMNHALEKKKRRGLYVMPYYYTSLDDFFIETVLTIKEFNELFGYNAIKQIILNTLKFKDLFNPPYNPKNNGIYLICFVDYLTLDEIISTTLNKVFLLGTSFKKIIADGYLLYPVEFMEHDIFHAKSFLAACQNVHFNGTKFSKYNMRDLKELLYFYDYCKHIFKDKPSEMYMIKLIFFYEIHEKGFCSYTGKLLMEVKNEDDKLKDFKKEILSDLDIDLALIPKRLYKDKDKGHNLGEDALKEVLNTYLSDCIDLYLKTFIKFITKKRERPERKENDEGDEENDEGDEEINPPPSKKGGKRTTYKYKIKKTLAKKSRKNLKKSK